MPAGTLPLTVLGSVVAANALIHLFAARIVLPLFERKVPFGVESFPPDETAERIRFPTSHGLTLRGSLHRPWSESPRGLVIFCPELGGNHWSALSYASALRDAGYAVLAFDFRNQGESESLPGYDPFHWLTNYEVADVQAALRYVRSRPDLAELPLGLFGISRGGAAALAAASRCRQVKAVACEGAYSTEAMALHYAMRWASLYIPDWLMRQIPVWHVQTTLAVARLFSQLRRGCRYTWLERKLHRLKDRPVQIFAGSSDSYVSAEITQTLCRRIPGCRPLHVVKRARHNQCRKVDPAGYDEKLLSVFAALDGVTASRIRARPCAR